MEGVIDAENTLANNERGTPVESKMKAGVSKEHAKSRTGIQTKISILHK